MSEAKPFTDEDLQEIRQDAAAPDPRPPTWATTMEERWLTTLDARDAEIKQLRNCIELNSERVWRQAEKLQPGNAPHTAGSLKSIAMHMRADIGYGNGYGTELAGPKRFSDPPPPRTPIRHEGD